MKKILILTKTQEKPCLMIYMLKNIYLIDMFKICKWFGFGLILDMFLEAHKKAF